MRVRETHRSRSGILLATILSLGLLALLTTTVSGRDNGMMTVSVDSTGVQDTLDFDDSQDNSETENPTQPDTSGTSSENANAEDEEQALSPDSIRVEAEDELPESPDTLQGDRNEILEEPLESTSADSTNEEFHGEEPDRLPVPLQAEDSFPRPDINAEPDDPEFSLDSLIVPTGMDTAVAEAATRAVRRVMVGHEADSLASLFREMGRIRLEHAQPIAEYLKSIEHSTRKVGQEDSIQSSRRFRDAQMELSDALGDLGGLSIQQIDRAPRRARQSAAAHLENARGYLQKSVELDPMNRDSYDLLIQVYSALSFVQRSVDNYQRAIELQLVLMELNEDDPNIPMSIGNYYEIMGDPLKASVYYRMAQDKLLFHARFESQDRLPEEEEKYWTEYTKGLYQFAEAMYNDDDYMRVNRRLQYMGQRVADPTFDPNIEDRKRWKEITTLAETDSLDDIREARRLSEELLPDLQFARSRFLVQSFMARWDFTKLDERDRGLGILRSVLDSLQVEEINPDIDSLFVTEGIQAYVNRLRKQADYLTSLESDSVLGFAKDAVALYSQLCFFYGSMYLNDKNDPMAFKWYYQASMFQSQRQAEALKNLAMLSARNPRRVTLYGEAAVHPDLVHPLSLVDQKYVLKILRIAYHRLGNGPEMQRVKQRIDDVEAQLQLAGVTEETASAEEEEAP
ncbi:hypothetical protein GF324_13735 [bacterium]|nr:hypothetical protein [bacterium]